MAIGHQNGQFLLDIRDICDISLTSTKPLLSTENRFFFMFKRFIKIGDILMW